MVKPPLGKHIKNSLVFPILFLVINSVYIYYSVALVKVNLSSTIFLGYLTLSLPLLLLNISLLGYLSYVYYIRYRKMLSLYQEEYKKIIERTSLNDSERYLSLLDDLVGESRKDGNKYLVINEDEFGTLGETINIVLSEVYEIDTEKSKRLLFQKELISKLLEMVPDPLIGTKNMKVGNSTRYIVNNVNSAFLSKLRIENVVKLVYRLYEILKIGTIKDKYIYDIFSSIVRGDIEDFKDYLLSEETNIEEFLIDIWWFMAPVDERAMKIIQLLIELLKGEDLLDIPQDITLDVLKYEEYREKFISSFSGSEIEGIIPATAPEDEISFLKKQESKLFSEGLEIEDFKFALLPPKKLDQKVFYNSPYIPQEDDIIIKSKIKIIPIITKKYKERDIFLKFLQISLLS
jgi:hypothetical protein